MINFKGLAFLLVVSAVFIGCDGIDLFDKKQTQNSSATNQIPAVPVDVFVAKKGDFPIAFEYPARIESEQSVIIKPKVSGTLKAKKFISGQKVKAGDVLFMIEPDKYEVAVLSAKADVDGAKANLINAESEFKRVKNLFSENAASQKELDSANATFKSANARLLSANAALKNANLDLEYTKVKAPFDGVVGDHLVDVGTFINASSTELVRLSKLNPVVAKFYIADTQMLNLLNNINNNTWQKLDQNATLLINDSKLNGVVKFIDSVIDEKSASVLAKAEFKNDNHSLLPGMFARIKVDGFIQKNSFKIPQVAVLQDSLGAYVLVIKDGKATKKSIKIPYQTTTEAIVSEGLNEFDEIIINNFKKIRVGSKVVAQNAQGSK